MRRTCSSWRAALAFAGWAAGPTRPAPATALSALAVTVAAFVAASAAAGCASRSARTAGNPGTNEPATDNARRAGYVGTATCATCHAELVRTFVQSPMHNMTRPLGATHPETVVHAPFSGAEATFRFHDDIAVASAEGGERFLDVENANPRAHHRYRLTKVIGGRVREDFVGVEVARANPAAKGSAASALPLDGAEERVLPVTWLIGEQRWRYKGYSVMTKERSHLANGALWRTTCIGCHNTMTLLDAQAAGIAQGVASAEAANASASSSAQRADVGTNGRRAATKRISSPLPWPDRLLPTNERRALFVLDADRLAEWAAQADARVANFGEADLVELGIGCEACHAGGAMHAADPRNVPSFDPVGAPYKWTDPMSIRPGGGPNEEARAHATSKGVTTPPNVTTASQTGNAGLDALSAKALAVNRACSRCHQVLFSAYPWTWEGGTRARAAGGSSTTSGEARDFLLGPCVQKMYCTNCHDPHGGTARAAEVAMATPAGNTKCTSCHPQYADDASLRAHAHHDPRGAGGACLACHMAKKNMGLDGHLTRYHRIGSPTDSQRVLFDRPLECATCHPGASARSLIETMETWFGRRYERAPLEALYGDLDQPVLLSTLERGKPHEKAVAAELLGLARDRRALPGLLHEVSTEAYPIVQDYARAAIEAIDPTVTLPPRDRTSLEHGSGEPEED